IQAVPDAADRLARAAPAAGENRWAAACLARAAGRRPGNIDSLEESMAEGRAELDALGCPPPAV
ncbi:MAG: hypothetical protein ACTHPS_07535, partial [Streptosporangiaceae bacterium]